MKDRHDSTPETLQEAGALYRALIDTSPDAIVLLNLEYKVISCNRQAAQLHGFQHPDDLLGRLVLELIKPEDRGRATANALSVLETGDTTDIEYTLLQADGNTFPAEVYISLVRGTGGEPQAFLGVLRDISDRKRADEAMAASERRYRQLFERSMAGMYRSTTDGRILDCNDALVRMLGCESREELLGSLATDFYNDAADRQVALTDLETRHGLVNKELCLRRKDGTPLWVLESSSVIEWDEDHPAAFEGTLVDITERKMLEEQLTYQAFHDALTKLPNRALFMDRLEHALARSGRRSDSVGVLFLDLDDFKLINDSLGHKVGDQLLVAAAQRLLSCVRPGDTVARLGGDEFTLLLEDIEDGEYAVRVAQRVADELQAPFCLEDRDIFITTSIGIALSTGEQNRPDDLLRNADLAMYDAKNGGKSRYAVFEPGMNARVWERLQMEVELRRALDSNEFVVYYQPVMQLQTRRIVEVEALVRWQHPERGLVSPFEFIPVAEETGLILPLGQWVLEEACRQAKAWQKRFKREVPLMLSANLSPRQFRHPRLVSDIKQILAETGFDPNHLKLEITESVALDNTEATLATLKQLRALGIHIAIDDFGTGYAALSYLKKYPVDTLKLDRSFVSGLGRDPQDTAILHAMVAFAKTLKLSVIAEGIETPEQVTALLAIGCDWGQGFYFGRPMPTEALTKMLGAGTGPLLVA